jgi:hypothetical protein
MLGVLCVVRGLCDGQITGPEESYGVCGVSECDREASMMRPWPTRGLLPLGGGDYQYLVTLLCTYCAVYLQVLAAYTKTL